MSSPTSMLPSPAMRSSRSPIAMSCASAFFKPAGFTNGMIPSITKSNANAAAKSVK